MFLSNNSGSIDTYTCSQEVPSPIFTIFSLFTSTKSVETEGWIQPGIIKGHFLWLLGYLSAPWGWFNGPLDHCKNTETPQDRNVLGTWYHFLSALLLKCPYQHLCWASISGGIKRGRRDCGNAAIRKSICMHQQPKGAAESLCIRLCIAETCALHL